MGIEDCFRIWVFNIMTEKFNYRFLMLLACTVLITGCSNPRYYEEFVVASMYYPNVEDSKKVVRFGSQMINVSYSGHFKHTDSITHENFYGRSMTAQRDKGVVVYWSVKTPIIEKYYYAQSLVPNRIKVSETAKKGEPYLTHIFMSFGPMSISEEALTKEQMKTAKYIETWGDENNIYQWGRPQNYYYRVLRRGVNVEKDPMDWQIVEGIEISKMQFNQLDDLCSGAGLPRLKSGEHRNIPCFLDKNLINLTQEQSLYMAERPYIIKHYSRSPAQR